MNLFPPNTPVTRPTGQWSEPIDIVQNEQILNVADKPVLTRK